MVQRTETRRAASERYTELAAGQTVLTWRGVSCTLVSRQDIVLADGVTVKQCALIRVHGLDLFQSQRFVSASELGVK